MAERLADEDREAAQRLLDLDDEHYLGGRDDLFVLGTQTVHYGRLP